MDNQFDDLQLRAPTLEEVMQAAGRLSGVINHTPLLENRAVNEALSGRLLLKVEGLQRTGAFKFRGAYNRISQMTASEKKRGVVTYSSGNHARGVALAAKLLGTNALIVMPDDVPQAKMDATLNLGAKIETFDRNTQNNEDEVARVQRETGRIHVPPGSDGRVMAGNGTVAYEMFQQAKGIDANIDTVLVPCGSGGLTAATAVVMDSLSPKTDVFSVEPELFDDTRRSLEAGERVANPKGRKTICDAIMTPIPNELTFAINKPLLAGGLAVSDDEVRQAMLFAFERYKIVVEPGAAVGLAAVLSGKTEIKNKVVAVILTGANVDSPTFCKALAAARSMPQSIPVSKK
ncbi:MAG TPA: threonine/serine dehydratase [Rhizobiales bacterium]|nr:threonine/serine dehydratase [Hyphomicrobiales bacterium]